MKKKISNIYDSRLTYENILDAWNVVRRTCKDKKAVYRFQFNKMSNIHNIYDILKKREYRPFRYSVFMIFEPKARLVMNQCVYDKIINHFVSKYYLIPSLENKLIDANVATRKEKGNKYARELLEKYINIIRLKEPQKEIYVLKIDIKKYFYNINHNILINMLKRDIEDTDVINIVRVMLEETNKDYINEVVIKLINKYNVDLPLYKKDVGLAIGSMHSQFLAIYYLNDLDHYIKEKLKCKYYIRYMDDLVFLDTNKENLKRIWKIVQKEINKLELEVNPKSNIYRLSEGVPFVGYRFVITNNKFNITFNKKTMNKIVKRLNNLKKHDMVKYYRSYASYYGYFIKIKKDVKREFVMKSIDKYKSYKMNNQDKVIFIKEGTFFKTFLDDAVIIWNLFDYKWNNNSISFGVVPSSKVFDYLKSNDIGYMVIDDKETIVNGSSKVYNLHKELAIINYEKYQKKEMLYNKLNNILEKDFNKSDLIIEFLTKLEEKVTI